MSRGSSLRERLRRGVFIWASSAGRTHPRPWLSRHKARRTSSVIGALASAALRL